MSTLRKLFLFSFGEFSSFNNFLDDDDFFWLGDWISMNRELLGSCFDDYACLLLFFCLCELPCEPRISFGEALGSFCAKVGSFKILILIDSSPSNKNSAILFPFWGNLAWRSFGIFLFIFLLFFGLENWLYFASYFGLCSFEIFLSLLIFYWLFLIS